MRNKLAFMKQRSFYEKDLVRNPKNEKKITFEIKQKLNRLTSRLEILELLTHCTSEVYGELVKSQCQFRSAITLESLC